MVKALITHDPVGRLDQYSQLLYVDCSRYDGAGVYLFYRDGTLVPLRAQRIGDNFVDESGAKIYGQLVGKAVAGVCFYPPLTPCKMS